MAIIYRLVKGVPLTHAELDNNFTELVNSLSGKMDKEGTYVNDWLAYTDSGKVKGLGPGDIFVMGYGVTHADPVYAGGVVLTSYDVQTYESGHAQYKRWITRNTALTVLEDTGWIEVAGEKANKDLTINTRPSSETSYTLALSDRGCMVRPTNPSANTLTVPPNSSVAFPIGTQIIVTQAGAGQTTVVAGSGVTVNSSAGKMKFYGQWSGVTLVKTATNTWTLMGDIVA
jgi:hypothetical protein